MTPELPQINSLPPAVPPEPPANLPPRWGVRDLGLFLGFGLVALIIAYAGVMIGYVALVVTAGWRIPPESFQQKAYLSLAFQLVFYLLLFAAIYAMVALRKRLPLRKALNWKKPAPLQAAGFFAAGMILSVGVQFAPTIFPDKSNFPLQQFFTTPAIAYAVGSFAVLVAPWMEELVFRGVLFSIFEDQVGVRFAIVTTAVLFTALHIPEYRGAWNHLFLLLLVGLVFSLARGVTRSLAPSVLLHTAYNLTQLIMLYVATEHFRHFQSVLLR